MTKREFEIKARERLHVAGGLSRLDARGDVSGIVREVPRWRFVCWGR